jgi:predicted nucleic acid-binding protein
MTPMSNLDTLIVDANILISISSKEALTHKIAERELKTYVNNGWELVAPHIIVAEGMFALCQKLTAGVLTQLDYEKSVDDFNNYLSIIEMPLSDAVLMKRAVEIRKNYGCSRSSDGLYIALAEELSKTRNVKILTFDKGFINQIKNNAPTVKVNLLTV